jgi:hypothetical protein
MNFLKISALAALTLAPVSAMAADLGEYYAPAPAPRVVERRVVETQVVERPVVVERRVVVERPVTYVETAPVYEEDYVSVAPYAVGAAVVGGLAYGGYRYAHRGWGRRHVVYGGHGGHGGYGPSFAGGHGGYGGHGFAGGRGFGHR